MKKDSSSMKRAAGVSKRIAICLSLSVVGTMGVAQNNTIPSGKDQGRGTVVSAATKSITSDAQTLCVQGVDNTTTVAKPSLATWYRVAQRGDLYVEVAENFGSERTLTISLQSSDTTANKSYTITQQASENAVLAASLQGDTPVKATADGSGDNAQEKAGIELTIDGDMSTCYHSNWESSVTESSPVTLIYNFSPQGEHIDYLVYCPREGGGNGNFGKVDIYYKTVGDSDYKLFKNQNFRRREVPTTLSLGNGGMGGITSIKFVVKSGENNFASCAEMQFFKHKEADNVLSTIFADELMTSLVPGVTEAKINALSDQYAFYKNVARQMLKGIYSTAYRVSSHECLLSTSALSAQWSTPGKLYDQIQGVTGVIIPPGKSVVAVSGIPAGKSVTLRVIDWYAMPSDAEKEDKKKRAQGWYSSTTYELRNGVNIVNKTNERTGLAYICYYDDEPDAFAGRDVKVHFLNGKVQGYLSPEKSNEEMQQILDNAPYQCIDCFGSKVHSIWEVSALKKYTAGKYRKYLNVLDTIIAWQHRLLGLEKYNRIPKNKTMAYVNYDYYMYQGGFGVSFMYDTQNRCCSPENIMKKDDDVVWGLAHEWGHQHQMLPYFCWAGLSESSNNMNSCDNVLRMGYAGGRILNGWSKARTLYLEDKPIDGSGRGTISKGRVEAFRRSQLPNSPYGWNPKIQAMAEAMKDSVVYSQTDKKFGADRATSINECYVEQNLAPFFMLHCYFTQNGLPDFTPDLYESLRQTDAGNDKYELIASTQNGKDGKYAALAAAHPKSAWVTQKYVSASSTTWQNSVPYIFNYIRKASKITGYNLYPYFEKWGFFRLIALYIGDYGDKYYCMLDDMKKEFEKDMKSLKLKKMDSKMVDTIATIPIPKYETPEIPN